MAADNEAEIKLLLNAGQALGSLNSFVGEFKAGLAAVGAAAAIGFATEQIEEFFKASTRAALALQAIQIQLSAVNDSSAAGGADLEFLRHEAERLGLPILELADGFAKLEAAAKGTRLEGQGARDIFTAIAEASRVLHLSAQQTELSLFAVQQMLSKGKVSAEELRRQLGDNLPGAFNIAARAAGVTTAQLDAMLKSGKLISADFLPKFAKELHNTFSGGINEAAAGTQAAIQRFNNAVLEAQAAVGAWLTPAIGELSNAFAQFLSQHRDDLGEIGRGGGKALGYLVDQVHSALVILDRFGIKLQDLPQLVNPATVSIKVQEIALRNFTQSIGLGYESTVTLTGAVKPLSVSLEILASREKAVANATRDAAKAADEASRARDVEAGATLAREINKEIEARHKLRDTINGDVGALNKETDALISVIAAEQNRGGVTEEQSKRTVDAIAAQLSKYDELGLKPPQALEALAKALGILTTEQNKARDSLLGNVDALNQETATMVTAVTQIIAHGDATKAQSARIVEAITAQRDKYAELGLKTPADLDAIIARLGILSTAQQKVTSLVNDTLKAFAAMRTAQDPQAAAGAPAAGDAQKRVDDLKQEVSTLEESQKAGATTIQQDEDLAAKKIELSKAQQDLNLVTLDGAKALDTFGQANQQSASNVQETINQLRLANGEIDAFGSSLNVQNQNIADAATLHGKLKDGVTEVTNATVAATAATVDNAKSLGDAAASAKAAAVETDALAGSLGELGKAGTSSGEALGNALDKAHSGALATEVVLKRVDEEVFPSLLMKAEKLASILAGTGQPGALGN